MGARQARSRRHGNGWVPSRQPATAPYSPAPRSVPGPHEAMSVDAFNSIFPNVRVAPLVPRYSVGLPALFARRIEPRVGLPGGSACWNSSLIVALVSHEEPLPAGLAGYAQPGSAVALASAGQRVEPTWLVCWVILLVFGIEVAHTLVVAVGECRPPWLAHARYDGDSRARQSALLCFLTSSVFEEAEQAELLAPGSRKTDLVPATHRATHGFPLASIGESRWRRGSYSDQYGSKLRVDRARAGVEEFQRRRVAFWSQVLDDSPR
jgi:hypothetical protein